MCELGLEKDYYLCTVGQRHTETHISSLSPPKEAKPGNIFITSFVQFTLTRKHGSFKMRKVNSYYQ